MTLWSRTTRLAALILCMVLITLFLSVCDDRTAPQDNARKAEAQHQEQLQEQRQEQLQAQLHSEQEQRLAVEKAARAAESSRVAWIIGLAAGAGLISLVALLMGIHIGARAWTRRQKEQPHG